jgi:IS5 family transposase
MSIQVEIVCLEDLVPQNHPYRYFKKCLPMVKLSQLLSEVDSKLGRMGFGAERLFLGLLLQFMENLSDRELERYCQENTSAKWFCGYQVFEKTPDHSVFCKARKRIGTKKLSEIFTNLRDELKSQGYISEVFTFVDACHLISKANLWKERDRAIQKKYNKLNNEVLPKIAVDKQARIGCKGDNKFWYGYKQQISVDMPSGLINKVAIVPANETDAQGFKRVCPNQGAVYADKGYCTQNAVVAAKCKSCHLAAIKKNNMVGKNRDLDRWYSAIRAPFERVFSKRELRVRYQGIAKNQFAAFMQAISFNLKRLRVLNIQQLFA